MPGTLSPTGKTLIKTNLTTEYHEKMKRQKRKVTEEEAKKEPAQRRITFDLSTVSLGLGIGGILVAGLIIPPGVPLMLFGLVGLVAGVSGIFQRKRRGRKVSGDTLAMGGVIINLLCIALSFSMLLVEGRRYKSAYRIFCGSNMHGLGKAILLYAKEHGDRYPTCNHWCDLLIKYANLSPKQFVCKAAMKKGDAGPSHYAMNPYCEPNSPNDVVLLFETKGGWNQYGGSELLTFNNHQGNGANVLFNDGYVEFVRPDKVDEMNWGYKRKETE